MRKLLVGVVALVSLVGITACDPPPPPATPCSGFSSSAGTCVSSSLTVGGTSYSVDWYLPTGQASALMLLQHGFSRGCGNLRGTSKAIMEKGLMVLCLNAPMAGGNPALAAALGDLMTTRQIVPPSAKALPDRYIVGGHSAGGHFASEVGARLAAKGDSALRGAVLFDPVASEGFSSNVAAISAGGTRPVLTVAARPSLINLSNNSFGALRDLTDTFVGIQLVWKGYFLGIPQGGSCHTDVEGEDGDVIGNTAAGCTPDPVQVGRLRDFGATWAHDLATGSRTAAYWCTDARTKSTCGAKVTALVGGWLPTAALVPVA